MGVVIPFARQPLPIRARSVSPPGEDVEPRGGVTIIGRSGRVRLIALLPASGAGRL
jgi:hypothetical protein